MFENISWKLVAVSGKIYTPQDFTLSSSSEACDKYVDTATGFSVTVKKKVCGDITWGTLNISNQPEQILDVRYPVVELPYDDKYDILYGYDLGTIIKSSKVAAGSVQTVRLLGIPVFALLNDNGGFYFDARRREVRSNGADYFVSEDRKSIRVEIIHDYSEKLSGIDAAYGTFSGKWFDAAEIYRNWRAEYPLFPTVAADNTLKDIDLWIWNRGPISEVLPPVLELKKRLPDCKLALNWYWWHAIPYDTEYPDFWPPREGEENFKAAVKQLTDLGIYVQVYINGVCWDVDGKSWCDGAMESVMIDNKGDVMCQMFNTYTRHRLGYMCGEGKTFRKRMVELVTTLHSCGLTGQYMDMISHMGTHHCYNPRHKHAPGDVQIMLDGYREMIDDIHAVNPGLPITSESCGECFLDKLSGVTVCNSISSEHLNRDMHEVVPLFPAVYHGQTVLFGNYASLSGIPPWDTQWPPEDRWQKEEPWHELYPDQYYIESSRNIIFGVQPTVCDFYPKVQEAPEYATARSFLLDSVNFYHANKDFLFSGKMLSPAGFVCDETAVDFHGRMIFTKRDAARKITKQLPAILHSVWENQKGEKALFLANYTQQARKWSFNGISGEIPPRSFARIEL